MMGMDDLFKSALGDFAEGAIGDNGLAARAMLRQGLAVLLIAPGGKKPVCTLTAKQESAADNAAQKEAREGGTVNWTAIRHKCGVYHAITDPKELTKPRVKEWLEAGANLAVVPAMSSARVIVVDLDTKEERRGFMEDWRAADETITEEPPMTVSSPGVMSAEVDGTEIWSHKFGGHYWFTIPEDAEALPESPGKLRGPSGWTVYYGSGYVLVPPSVRPEGPYRLTGATVEAPTWLLDAIRAGGTTGSAEELRERIRTGDTDEGIDSWSANTPWSDLLGAYGYMPTGQLDSCGCPTWTRPGQPVHAKSATAHEVGCPQYTTDSGHAPIHAWSDSLRWNGKQTVTKLTFLAAEGFGGSMTEAMAYIGVAPNTTPRDWSELDFGEGDSLDFDGLSEEGGSPPKADQGETADGEVKEVAHDSWKPRDLGALLAGTVARVEPTLLPRSDGRLLLYPGKVHSIHGESESGKSLVLMGEAARIMEVEHGDVLWITFDSDAEEDIPRAIRFGCTPETLMAHLTYVQPDEPPQRVPESYKALFKNRYALVVIDGVTDAVGLLTAGAKGDPNEVYSAFSRIFPRKLATMTGAAVVLVDHVAKDTDTRGRFAIGAQAKMAELTGAAYLAEPDKEAPTAGGVGTVILRVGKDRPAGVRRYCGPRRARDRTQEAARITFDDTGETTIMTVEPPQIDPFEVTDAVDGPAVDMPYSLMQTVSEVLEGKTNGLAKGSIEAAVNGKASRKRLAMDMLVELGYARLDEVGSSKILTLVEPYLVEFGDVRADEIDDADVA
jgi:hypothetical protein